ncbi:NAD(+) synthase, partial [Candidatus Saccharibacteria bacterium]|nr:NAD(+) synthase [Candidatus Saccharibacteria bacterium]
MTELLMEPQFEKPTADYFRVMTASPEVAVADPAVNTVTILAHYAEAKAAEAELLALPELCVTGYTTADMFFNKHVRNRTEEALTCLAEATLDGPAMVVGAPLVKDGLLYNCAVMLAKGEIAGVVPKTFLPNYNEFYEKRWFTSGRNVRDTNIKIGQNYAPFGTDLLFDVNGTNVGIEVCEDAFAPIPPSAELALAKAEVIINPSASNELIGKEDFRRRLITGHAANFICAYVYTSAGKGESNADVVYGGHQMIAELGKMLDEVTPFTTDTAIIDIDTAYIEHDRLKNKTYADQAAEFRQGHAYRTISVDVPTPTEDTLKRIVPKEAFEPQNQAEMDRRCETLFNLMAYPLAQRLLDGGSDGIVLGLSGGLDSTLALLTAQYACQIIGKPNSFIHTVTMPGEASSVRTQSNASKLAESMGTTHHVMPIGDLTQEALEIIGHDTTTEDITYENTQARMRTLLL